jgi:peptidoglycan-associated lipoprotein
MRTLSTSALVIASAFLFTACSSTPVADNKAATADTTPTTAPSTSTQAVTPVAATPTPAKPVDLNLVPIKRSVFFDYDKFDIKPEFNTLVEDHAKYLIKNPARKAVIEGNADERGGREYNLALGQKRAEAERKALELLGVPSAQLEAISYGKEKPRTHGHDEAAWADNRRADVVYKSK